MFKPHALHPSILDNLGLVAAVESFCREISEQSGVVVNFANRNTPDSLPPDVSLSLFRVVQEALRNAVKYSGQNDFEVHLQGTPGGLELQVLDRGIGFDVGSVRKAGGLGLISMRERIQLVNGAIQVDSKPNGGTRIRVHVPLGIKSNVLTRGSNLLGDGFQSNP